MSEQTVTVETLAFDRADRMRRALRISGVSVQEMADYLGVRRNTVSTWINGHRPPSAQTLRLWAMRTGVPKSWLETGLATSGDGPDGGPLTNPYVDAPLRLLIAA